MTNKILESLDDCCDIRLVFVLLKHKLNPHFLVYSKFLLFFTMRIATYRASSSQVSQNFSLIL